MLTSLSAVVLLVTLLTTLSYIWIHSTLLIFEGQKKNKKKRSEVSIRARRCQKRGYASGISDGKVRIMSTKENEQTRQAEPPTRQATAVAFANLALVKYFGKRNLGLNLPAAASLSLTLAPLRTETTVSLDDNLQEDHVQLQGTPATETFQSRVAAFLDIIRKQAGDQTRARIETDNNFPTAAGLASSASGFAALTLAAASAMGLDLEESELSALARRGSGSAARSIPGGICIWHKGEKADGSDSFAESIAAPDVMDLRVVVGVTDPGPKSIGSTQAMEQVRETSPYYGPWIKSVEVDMNEAVKAVSDCNLARLGEVAERNALAMHAAALAARPGILFWKGSTVEGIHLVRQLRKKGILAYFTCDAGPQTKVLTSATDAPKVVQALEALPGVVDIIECRMGGRAMVL